MEFKQGEMYKVVLAYSMNDELFTYPPTLIGKCLLSNEKHATLLDPLTNVVQGFKLSQVSTAEPYEASKASVKPETSSVAGKSSGSSVVATDAPNPKALSKPSIRDRLGDPFTFTHGYFTRSKGSADDTVANTAPRTVRAGTRAGTRVAAGAGAAAGDGAGDESSETIALRTKIQTMLENILNSDGKFTEELPKNLTQLNRMINSACAVEKGNSIVFPILSKKCIYYKTGNKEELKQKVLDAFPSGTNIYLFSMTEFITNDSFSSFKIPTPLFVCSSTKKLLTHNLK